MRYKLFDTDQASSMIPGVKIELLENSYTGNKAREQSRFIKSWLKETNSSLSYMFDTTPVFCLIYKKFEMYLPCCMTYTVLLRHKTHLTKHNTDQPKYAQSNHILWWVLHTDLQPSVVGFTQTDGALPAIKNIICQALVFNIDLYLNLRFWWLPNVVNGQKPCLWKIMLCSKKIIPFNDIMVHFRVVC